MYLAIVGSRNMADEEMFTAIVDAWIVKHGRPDAIVSGGATGADTLARLYAQKHHIQLIEYLPDWKKYKRAAGIIRNTKIIEDANYVLAFPSQSGKGTQDSIKKAELRNIPVEIYYID